MKDDIKEIMKENIPALIQQNQNLQAELDKVVHKLSDYEKALKHYAESEPIEIKKEYFNGNLTNFYHTMADIGSLARETLKKWENK